MKAFYNFKIIITTISFFLMNKNSAYSQEKQIGHSHHTNEIVNLENAIAKKLNSVQLIFDADSVKGFNEIGALDQVSSGGAPEWEQKIQMSYLKRRYINTKYNLNKYASTNGGISTVQAPCTNVGFENGTVSGWTITEGINMNSLTMGGCCPNPSIRYSIVTPGVDSNFPTLQRVPTGGGNYALMIGDGTTTGGYAVRVSQTFSVTSINTLFIYKFAVILEDALHACADQPYMNISFTDASNNPISCGQYNGIPASFNCTTTPVDPSFTSLAVGTNTYNVKDWSTRAFDLSAYLGQNVTVAFTVSDCVPTGHAAYCYVDASCLPMTLNLNGVDLPYGQTNTDLCGGVTSNTLCAPTGFTYNWTGPSVTGQTGQCITPTSSGSYSVTLGIIGSAVACSTVPKLYTTLNFIVSPTITIASVSSPTICSGNTATITPSGASTYTLNPGGLTGSSFVVSPTVTTIYSITGTSSLSCSNGNTVTTIISVNPTPTLSILSVSSLSICSGNSTVITPTVIPAGAASYTLNPGNLIGTSFTVSPSSTTTYSLVGMSSANCPSSNTITTKITVNAIPISTASTTGSITCVNNSINLNSTLSGAGITYTWTAPAGSSIAGSPFTQNTTGQGLGTYTLNLKGPGGCAYSTTVAAIQNTTTPTSVSAGATQTLICGVPAVNLAGSATPTTATANWLGGVTNPTSFTTTTGSAGTYTLQAVDPITGCFVESTVSVMQSVGSPIITADPVTFSITCTNSMVPIGVVVTSTNSVTYQWSTTGISGSTTNSTATATLAGVYNVTVTNSPGNNCTTIKSITVPTDITPVVASITPAATITCSVPTLTLNAVPGGANYTYTWTGTSAIVSGSLTQNPIINNGGIYSVAITNTVNGCVGFAAITVYTNPLPNVMISTSNTLLCVGQTASLTATGASSYTWNTTGTTSVIAVSPITTTNYTVTGVDGNGCMNTATITQSVTVCSDIQTVISNETISIYPNPTSGIATIEINATFNVIIMDVLGKVVYNQTLNKGKHIINLSNYANGLYFVKATSNGKVNTTRLIKE